MTFDGRTITSGGKRTGLLRLATCSQPSQTGLRRGQPSPSPSLRSGASGSLEPVSSSYASRLRLSYFSLDFLYLIMFAPSCLHHLTIAALVWNGETFHEPTHQVGHYITCSRQLRLKLLGQPRSAADAKQLPCAILRSYLAFAQLSKLLISA